MILFYNVLITDTRSSVGGMNRVDRLDLFKYSLASYACISLIDEVIIYCELAGGYKAREGELRAWVDSLFPKLTVHYHNHSPSNQPEWCRALAIDHPSLLTTTKPIIYMGNDDHIFIDYDLDVLYEGLALMMAQPPDQINTYHFSSWSESVSTFWGINEFKLNGRHWEADLLYPDASQIVNSTYFRHVFFDLNMGGDHMRRTDPFLTNYYPYLGDYKYPSRAPHPKVKTFLPLREMVRHFDAYWHIGVPFEYCPMLEIPEGFFKREIDLYNHRGSVPLSWRGRIAVGQVVTDSTIKTCNEAHRRAMIAPHNRQYQRPTARTPAVFPKTFRDSGDFTELPIEDGYIKIGYRS